MEIKKLTRLALNSLSKEVFSSSSRWQKLVDKGYSELVTEDTTETVPAEKEGEEATIRQVTVPVLVRGSQQFVKKFHTVESVMTFMQDRKKMMDDLRAKFEAMQEEQKRKREEADLAKKVNNALAGSAKI